LRSRPSDTSPTPSETKGKTGNQLVYGNVELIEKLGRKDPWQIREAVSRTAVWPPARYDGIERDHYF
jgi:hypothetical protein